jgi:O-acetylhomoserine/O-acetylserine sulfhydrylase-like pyridoxal-dependent enzyme
MGAAAATFDLLPVGATVALVDDCYHAVAGLAAAGAAQGRWHVVGIGAEDASRWVELGADADLLWLESPTNPLLAVADLRTICAARRNAEALVVVDSTFATPLSQRPLDLGADLVVHSATKYLGGHSDLLLGAVVAAADEHARRLRERRKLAGATPGALDTYLAVRRMRTLPLRLQRASASAAELAERLAHHPGVTVVRYPGRADHPTHATARSFMAGFGAVVTFDAAGRSRARRRRLPIGPHHPPRHEPGRRRVDHRTPSRRSRPDPPAARTTATQRRMRTPRRPLARPPAGPHAMTPPSADHTERSTLAACIAPVAAGAPCRTSCVTRTWSSSAARACP